MKVIHIDVNQATSMADALEKHAALFEQMVEVWGNPQAHLDPMYGRYSLQNVARFLRRAVEDEVGYIKEAE